MGEICGIKWKKCYNESKRERERKEEGMREWYRIAKGRVGNVYLGVRFLYGNYPRLGLLLGLGNDADARCDVAVE